MNEPGRTCPLRYRYAAGSIAQALPRRAQTLYLIGGLYGNVPALDVVERMAADEPVPASLCFNGDFHWFDVADDEFAEVDSRVLAHDATLGNVEAELGGPDQGAGCGCAYPDSVDTATVERSNLIHARLKATAARHPGVLARIGQLPMVARYQVGECRVGVVHGDAESLAGWRFDVRALGDPRSASWLRSAFVAADVDVFASSHTCLPAQRRFSVAAGRVGWVSNNGAAGMPNFRGDLAGLCTRISVTRSPHPVLHEVRTNGAYVALVPVRFDAGLWQARFLAQWPAGSPAWSSYFERISRGPGFGREQALGLAA